MAVPEFSGPAPGP